jgi:CheY-like chemotaxis protein
MQTRPYILCAEDNLNNQLMIAQLLDKDFELACTTTGQACLESIEERKPDLLLMGEKMPLSIQGNVCSYLRTHQDLKEIPIISLFPCEHDCNFMVNGKPGCDICLQKPLEKHDLTASINKLLHS